MNSVLNRRGLSPVVATVLLILLVVVIALIIFLWFKSITKEGVTKFGSDVSVVCGDSQQLQYDVSYDSNSQILSFVNNGEAPIYDFTIIATNTDAGSSDPVSLRDQGFTGLASGSSKEVPFSVSGASELKVIPVLLGETSSGETRTQQCDDSTGTTVTVA